MHRFEVHSNESVCRKSGRLGLEQVTSQVSQVTCQEKCEGNMMLGRKNQDGYRHN